MIYNSMNNPMYDKKSYFKKVNVNSTLQLEVGLVIAIIIGITILFSIFFATTSVIVDGYGVNSFTNRQYSNSFLSFIGSVFPLALSSTYVFFRYNKIGIKYSLLTIVLPFSVVYVVTWVCTVFVQILGLIGIN